MEAGNRRVEAGKDIQGLFAKLSGSAAAHLHSGQAQEDSKIERRSAAEISDKSEWAAERNKSG